MKNSFLSFLVLAMSLLSFPVFSQTDSQTEKDSTLLSLPGDNLDLYAVMDLFQKSKTVEDFEKSLNDEKTGINNLDLDLNNKVDFIKVVTKKDGDDFSFILQVAVNEKETQDVAVILVSKDKDKKVTMQIVGDKDLYGKDYIVEPKATTTPASTANPGYTGADPVTVNVPATTTVVTVESSPVVVYMYSPVYVPYVPPYYYGYYPPYYNPLVVPIAIGIYHSNHYPYHGGYSHGNTVVIHNTNNYNNYNNSRNSSNTVNHNNANGNYNRNNASTSQSKGSSASTRPSTSPSTSQSKGSSASTRPSTSPSFSQSKGSSASTRPSTSPSTSQSKGSSASTRPSTSNYSSSSASRSNSMGSSRSGGGGGGGRRR